MRSKFEEKSYENYFNTELARQTDIYFPLGQVQEGSLGFDTTAFSTSRILWTKLGRPFLFTPHFSGIDLSIIAAEMENLLSVDLNNIPKIKTNLLFQYKKPEYIKTSKGKEWIHWSEPYYRYNIYKEQHDLLEHINHNFGNQVFIVYASPALHEVDDLVKAYIAGQIINVSNFKKASELTGHHRNTYVLAGRHSIACSEPTRIENFNLIEAINQFSFNSNSSEQNKTSVINFAKQLSDIMYKNSYYAESFKSLNERYLQFIGYELLYNHLVVLNFTQLTGIQWLIKI